MTALLERKNQEAQIRKAEKPEEISIVKPALFPAEPINPLRTGPTGVMGLLIGLVVGMIAAFIVETFDTSLGAIEEVEETLKSPVWGVIPQAEEKNLQEVVKEHLPEGLSEFSSPHIISLVSHFAPKSMMAESLRALRTNVQGKAVQSGLKALSVTSASPQEGKTLVSVNLSIAMAQTGLKTLLVGSDMRKPSLGRAFGLEHSPGLSDILLGNLGWRQAVKTISDIMVGAMALDEIILTPGLDNLHIITSGAIPPNPAELIDSRRLRDFVEEAKKEYDFIVLDSPPILSTADAVILAAKMDGVLLVYRIGTVSRGLLKRATTQLEQVKSQLMGVVLNGMKPDISPDFEDLRHYKHYYSYGEEEHKGHSLKGAKKKLAGRKYLGTLVLLLALITGGTGFLRQRGSISFGNVGEETKASFRYRAPQVVNEASPPVVERIEAPSQVLAVPQADHSGGSGPDPEKELPPERLASFAPGPFPYSLYLGSLKTVDLAKRGAAEYEKKGVRPFWVKVNFVEKGEWYRLFVGQFRDHGEAEAFALQKGLDQAKVFKTQYANLIGEYSRERAALEARGKLVDLDWAPYTIRGDDGAIRLLVGAYVTREAAEGFRADLLSMGVESRVVER